MTDKDELAALKQQMAEQKAEIEALKAAQPKPEPKPFTPAPYEPIDWTARMSMPPSALREMVAAEPRGFMKGVVSDNRGPTSATGMIPSSQQRAEPGSKSSTPGYVDPRPLSNPPGVAQADRLMDAADARDRIELAHRIAAHEAAMRAAEKGKG